MNLTIVTGILATILLQQMVNGFDYCQVGICSEGKVNIACNATGDFGPQCPPEHALVSMTNDLKAYLLQKHNQARSDFASGKYAGFETANRMVEMTWDDELAKLAEYLAKTCVWGHDQCRNTDAYRLAGQNIAAASKTPVYFETIDAIDYLFGAWLKEYAYCDMAYINSLGSDSSNSTYTKVGHFTQIVTAGANKLGCALTTYDSGSSWKRTYFVCNYSLTNVKGRAVYTTGAPASACTTGTSPTYPSLCSSAEIIP